MLAGKDKRIAWYFVLFALLMFVVGKLLRVFVFRVKLSLGWKWTIGIAAYLLVCVVMGLLSRRFGRSVSEEEIVAFQDKIFEVKNEPNVKNLMP